LVGPRLPLSFDQERVIDLKYSVTPDGPSDCPARFVFPKAFFEGSGSLLGCSLNTAADLSSNWISGISWLLPAGAFAMARLRRRKK